MNSGVVSGRVYDALKERLLAGEWIPGSRLDPARLGEELASSVTPVRDGLNQLVGERLVDARVSEGFHVPLVTEPGLRDLYSWNADLLRLAIGGTRKPGPGLDWEALRTMPYADVVRRVFEWVAAASVNAEHRRQVSEASDRLSAARYAEERCMADPGSDLTALAGMSEQQSAKELGRHIAVYHRRRLRDVPVIVRALYRT